MTRVQSAPGTGTPSGFRELFRYRKGQRTRTYGLKSLDEHRSELWVVACGPAANASAARRLATLRDDDDLPAFLEDIQLELRRGHWALAV